MVPSEEPWAKICRGVHLGSTVDGIRTREIFVKDRPERREWLDSIGFLWDEFEHRWTQMVVPGLLTYRAEDRSISQSQSRLMRRRWDGA